MARNDDYTGVVGEHIAYRHQIFHLAWLDLVRSYRGAWLGWSWAVVRPFTMLFVYWFVLAIGLRVDTPTADVDLFSWLAVGLIVWFYIADILSEGTKSFVTYKHIVTKMRFPISTIPSIVVLSNLVVHLILLLLVLLFLGIFKGDLSIHWIQLPIYMVLMVLFAAVWSLFSAPLSAMSKDFAQLVRAVTKILFWVSGIIWSVRTIDIGWIKTLMLFNPINFLVEGYRDSLLYRQWIWEEPARLGIFFGILLVMLFLAVFVFRSTRRELVDAL